MEAKVAHALTPPFAIQYRSSEAIWAQKAEVYLDERAQGGAGALQVVIFDDLAGDGGLEIRIPDLQSVRAKDYIEDGAFFWVLHLVEKSGKSSSFEFDQVESRDTWLGLSTLLKESDHELDGEREVRFPIGELKAQDSRPGMLASVDLLIDGQQVRLDLPEWKVAPDEWKEHVAHFIRDHHVLASEGNALYRYVKALASRTLIALEAKHIVNDIDNLYINRLFDVAEGDAKDMPVQLGDANIKLTQIEHHLARSPIWQSGVGPVMAATLLRRNIEKMKIINEMTASARRLKQLELVETAQRSHRSSSSNNSGKSRIPAA